MKFITCSVLTLLASCIVMHAQSVHSKGSVNPKDVLRKADSASRLVRTASYSGKVYGGTTGDPDFTCTGAIRLRRLDRNDELPAQVRIDLDNGYLRAYDGTTLYELQPQEKRILSIGPEIPGSSFITGNVVGRLVAFLEDSLYVHKLSEATRITYRGVQSVGDVPCHVVEVRLPDVNPVSQISQELYFGVEDFLTRRSITRYVVAGMKQQEGFEIHDLRVNTEVPDSTFVLALPEGYHREEYHAPKRPELLAVGTAAPDWTLTNASGQQVSLASLRGKVVMLDFWFTTCGPCVLAMPVIQSLHQQFGKRGVMVYGVNPYQEDKADAIRLMKRKHFSYGLLLNGGDVAGAYHISAYPTLYIIGTDGTIVYRDMGYDETLHDELARTLDQYLSAHGM